MRSILVLILAVVLLWGICLAPLAADRSPDGLAEPVACMTAPVTLPPAGPAHTEMFPAASVECAAPPTVPRGVASSLRC